MSADNEDQIKMAEELLFSDKHEKKLGPARAIFKTEMADIPLDPFPATQDEQNTDSAAFLKELDVFLDKNLDPVKIDLEENIPAQVIKGLGSIGMLGLTIPKNYGGQNHTQRTYCLAMKKVAARCGATAVFINAHQSIGLRAILLNGTDKQKSTYLEKLSSGDMLAAFALTEPEAGSDAANVQTRALYNEKQKCYIINGEKRWITNGGIAGVLTLMAKTKIGHEDKITAFLVTPDMPGFQVTERALKKCGIRGTATARLAFHDMKVPEENILGRLGAGLKTALTVLDYGRLTFGASCTGAAEFLVQGTLQHSRQRIQFNKPLCAFELVQEKLARMSAYCYAMDAATFYTAALFDNGMEDVMLETAMLKVFASDALWMITYESMQVNGGRSFFCDLPYERMMRDARLNTIGEGANEVLRVFIGLVGMRDIGMELKSFVEHLKSPFGNLGGILSYVGTCTHRIFNRSPLKCRSAQLNSACVTFNRDLTCFYKSILRVLARYREDVVNRQCDVNRIATAAIALFTSLAVLKRLDHDLCSPGGQQQQLQNDLRTGRYYLQLAHVELQGALKNLFSNTDHTGQQLSHLLTGLGI